MNCWVVYRPSCTQQSGKDKDLIPDCCDGRVGQRFTNDCPTFHTITVQTGQLHASLVGNCNRKGGDWPRMTVNHRIDAYEWSTDKLTILSHSIKLEMLWELMRLYDWRIITYISSFPGAYARKGSQLRLRKEMWEGNRMLDCKAISFLTVHSSIWTVKEHLDSPPPYCPFHCGGERCSYIPAYDFHHTLEIVRMQEWNGWGLELSFSVASTMKRRESNRQWGCGLDGSRLFSHSLVWRTTCKIMSSQDCELLVAQFPLKMEM